jgi:drug/metabolite transporter (DMT)-like permease
MMNGAAARPMGSAEWGMLVALSSLWGCSFFFVGVAVRELPPLTIVVLRVGLAALALHLGMRAMRLRVPTERRVLLVFLGMGLLNNAVPFTLMVWAQGAIASGLTAILNATTPLFAVLVAHVMTRDERATPAKLAGVLVGFAGVAALIGAGALGSLGVAVAAQLAVLAGALSYALAGVYGRCFKAMGVSPLATATGQVTASTLLVLPLALVVEHPWTMAWPSAAAIAAVLGLALVSTALAYILYFRLLASAGAVNLLLVTFLIPLSAVLLGAAFLGERLEPRHFAAMALIGLGLAAIDGRPIGWLRRRGRCARLSGPRPVPPRSG